MKRVELIIGSGTNQISLDLTPNAIGIALQYSIDDIRNIEKKNSNYSKNITLPGTKINNDAFGNLFDVNSSFTIYNPNKKVTARIVVDSSPVLQGYLQLTAVNKVNDVSLQGNKIEYSVIVFDDSVDFMQTVGDKLIKDLDFSDLDHVLNQTNIENAWNNHTFTDVYQYPLLDKNSKYYFTNDFKPAFYHKAFLLKIASDSGYKLEGSFITVDDNGNGPNLQYENEIIAWDGDTPKVTDSEALDREFRAGLVDASTTLATGIKTGFADWNSLNLVSAVNYDDVLFDNTTTYQIDQTIGSDLASTYTVPKGGKYDMNFLTNVQVDYTSSQSCTMTDLNTLTPITDANGSYAQLIATLKYRSDGSTIMSQAQDIGRYNSFTGAGTKTMNLDVSISITSTNLIEGEEVYVEFKLTTQLNFGWVSGGSIVPVTIDLILNNTLASGGVSVWYNKTVKTQNIEDGDILELNNYLPKDLKQKDILSDIIRRYNVYVRKHPVKQKTLILETRDDYYDNNPTVLDWTQKKDYNFEDKIQFLSDLQNKEILFSYKEADDLTASDGLKYNEAYTKSTGDIYGQKKIEFDNDFVKGTKDIESIFSTTPLIYKGNIGTDVVVPSISSTESKRKLVLLYWGGMIPVKDSDGVATNNLLISWGQNKTILGFIPLVPALNYTTYPYAGHYDNPYTPTLDIHFGEVTYEYYGVLITTLTNNNLFNNYWRNYINQISNGRLITSKFLLKETDINFIKDNLNARIFIKDSYYVINKIIDYKPLEEGLTTVELSRIEKGSTFTPTTTPPPLTVPTFSALADASNTHVSNNSGPFKSNVSNRSASPNSVIAGNDNYIGPDTTAIVNGNSNIIGGGSTGITVTGSDNIVQGGLTNVTIVGDGVTVTESNTSVINDVVFNNGLITSTNAGSYIELELGDWDMDANSNLNLAHSLSATEYMSIRNLSVTIRDDGNSTIFDFTSYQENTILVNSTNIIMSRFTTGVFDDPAFNATSYNRGWVTFNYQPD